MFQYLTDPVTAIHYKEESEEPQMDHHKDVEAIDS